jgi:hypothetical protein
LRCSRRHARLTSIAAAVLAGVAALVTGAISPLTGGGAGSLGRQALLVPICFGITHTVVVALGELTWPRPRGPGAPGPAWYAAGCATPRRGGCSS